MSLYFIAPGVYPETIDMSDRTQAPLTSIGAIVFASTMGPEEITFVSNTSQFTSLYGNGDPSWGWGHISAKKFLEKSSQLYCKRVQSGARHAGLVVANVQAGANGSKTFMVPFNSGRFSGYKNSEGSQKFTTLVLSAALVTANSVQVTFTPSGNPGGAYTLDAPVVFNGSSDATLQTLATAMQTKMNATSAVVGKNIGGVGVVVEGVGVSDDRVIWIMQPEDVDLDITATVTLGSSQATITPHEGMLFEIFAENPSDKGNDVGIQIRNVDNGTNQRRKMTFSVQLVTNNSFMCGVDYKGNRITIGPVLYATSHAATLTSIRNTLLTTLNGVENGWDAWVESNGLEITLVAPIDGPDVFEIVSPQVTGGTGQPTITVSQTMTGVDKDSTFEVWVYTRDNINFPKEKFKVSNRYMVDGYGNQVFMEEAINTAVNRSAYVRVLYNNDNAAGQLLGITSPTAIYWLKGGSNGQPPSSSQIMTAWDEFKNRSRRAVRLLINGGLTDPNVQLKMWTLAESRRDCFAILDMPSNKQLPQDAVDYRRYEINANTSYAAIYTPNIGDLDQTTNRKLFVPPSGFVAAQFAESDRKTAEWFAPAGLNRGLIPTIELRYEYDEGEVELLFSNNINPIVKKPGKGFPIWGAETLQSKASALSNIPVRRLLITIEIVLVDALEYQIYEPNDPYTWFMATQICNNLLQPIKEKRGLYHYLTVCNTSNNKPYHIDMGLMNIDVLLKPVLPVKFIRLASIVTRTGAVFSEIMGLLNNGSAGAVAA